MQILSTKMKFKSYNTANYINYTYDLAGNRLSAGAATYTYTHNRLDGITYDAASNVTSMVRDGVTLSLVWNSQHQLVSVATNGAFAESYAYDTIGRRISTTKLTTDHHSPATEYHVYDGDECVADLDASGNPLRTYLWGPGIDNLLSMTVFLPDSTNTYYAVKDHLGSVHALVDASGAIAERYEYDAWGCVFGVYDASGLPISNQQSQINNRFRFQGREYSSATGLDNFRARWYDPLTARWLSNDPIGISGGLNLYEFCGSNPVNFRDPWGKASKNNEPHRKIMGFFTHIFIRVPEYDENLCFTGNYFDLNFTADFDLLGGKSNYSIDLPFPFAWPIYHDRKSTPQENRDLLQMWRIWSEEQPPGKGHHYDPFINNCWNNVIDMQGMF